MPVPFDDLTESNHLDSVAWLRFVEEEGGRGIRAALFETSAQGEPLTFHFTRTDRCDPSVRHRGDAGQIALSSLAKPLFRVADGSPVLMFGLANEIPARVFTDELRVGVPFCRVGPAGAPSSTDSGSGRWYNRNPRHLLWVMGQPSESSDASRILYEIMDLDDPFEPFERAAKCLSEAFEYRRVRGLTGVIGLNTVVTLLPPERPEYPVTQLPATREASQSRSQGERCDLTLAARLWAVLAAPPKRPQPGWNTQLKWPGELMPFQQYGVRALLDMDQLLLADDMGLGKTIQAIAAIRILRTKREIRSCLVVAPASVLDQWRRETAKWAPELSAIIIRGSAADRSWQWAAERDVTLISYDTLRSDFGYNAQSPVRRRTWDVVVADEAQRIKNRNDTSNALKGLRRTRSWALTGTPIENHEDDLASIMEFVDHDGQAPPKRYHPGFALLQRHSELQLRRKKGEVLDDLPPKQVTKLTIALHPRQRGSYDKAERDGIIYLKSLGAEVGILHVLELIIRLKQICNTDPKTGESSKLEDIVDRLEQLTAQGHKALVFSQYTNDVSGVAAAARYLRKFNPLTLTGQNPSAATRCRHRSIQNP